MAFRIEITDLAEDDIDEAVTFIARDSVAAATKWQAGLETLILSLDELPNRFAIVPETDELQLSYRSAIYYSHRIVFRIDEVNGIVYVVRVYHGARRPLANEDVDPAS